MAVGIESDARTDDGVLRLPPEQRPKGSGRSRPVVSGSPWNSEQICMRYAQKHCLRLNTSSWVWSKIRATGDLSPTHIKALPETTEGREYLRVLLEDLWADWQQMTEPSCDLSKGQSTSRRLKQRKPTSLAASARACVSVTFRFHFQRSTSQ